MQTKKLCKCGHPSRAGNQRCPSCDRLLSREYRNSLNGRVTRSWYRINLRALNHDGKNPSYKDIGVNMTKTEFFEWAIPAYRQWLETHPNQSPSVHRIDDTKGYELGNLTIISVSENSKHLKRKTISRRREKLKLIDIPEIRQLCSEISRRCDAANIAMPHFAEFFSLYVKEQNENAAQGVPERR